jgi:hypothetical protein
MTRTTFSTLILFLALCPLTASVGCGDDDASGDTDSDSDSDTDTDVECDEALLPGVWLSTDYSVEFAEDLSYEAAGAPNLEVIDVYGQAAVDGCEVSFTDESGDFACPAEQVGVYNFTVNATTLAFTLVSDACDGRSIPLDGAVLTRE